MKLTDFKINDLVAIREFAMDSDNPLLYTMLVHGYQQGDNGDIFVRCKKVGSMTRDCMVSPVHLEKLSNMGY